LNKDRVSAGFLAGIIAGIAMNIVDWIGSGIGLYEERLLNWSAIALYGRLPINAIEIVFAQISQLFFSGFIGLLIASMFLRLTSENYLVKGWIFGVLAWFGLYALSSAMRLPTLETHEFNAVFSHFISASIYGIVFVLVLNRLDKKVRS